jgi:hypothetical protein
MVAKAFLVPERHAIDKHVKTFAQTGDIVIRKSDTTGALGIPFSRLVAWFTDSKWSHASMLFWEGDELYTVEVTDTGTLKMRFIDWLDWCVGGKFEILRYRGGLSDEIKGRLFEEAQIFLKQDPDYDFTYANPETFYCTESVDYLYQKVGITDLMVARTILDIVSGWRLWLLRASNWLVLRLTGKGFRMNVPVYYVGNSDHGLLSSDRIDVIYDHEG